MQIIYRQILQPAIGEFFDVDAAMSQIVPKSNPEAFQENDDAICSCCGPQRYHVPLGNISNTTQIPEGKFLN